MCVCVCLSVFFGILCFSGRAEIKTAPSTKSMALEVFRVLFYRRLIRLSVKCVCKFSFSFIRCFLNATSVVQAHWCGKKITIYLIKYIHVSLYQSNGKFSCEQFTYYLFEFFVNLLSAHSRCENLLDVNVNTASIRRRNWFSENYN